MSSNDNTITTVVASESFSRERSMSGKRRTGHIVTISIAFLAICRRDFLVGRREFLSSLIQGLLQPFFFLFIFGKVLPVIGAARADYAASLLPGIVALTTFMTAAQSLLMPLVLDLGHAHEIDDRLLAPLSVKLVAVEKVIFATIHGLIGGAVVFPLAAWMLGSGYQVRGDTLIIVLGLMTLTALAGATLGLTLGSVVQPNQLGPIFGVVFLPLIFTGCAFYPWISLYHMPWFMVFTLLNPLTYASEGLRFAMVPTIHGSILPTLPMGWVLLGLSVTTLVFLVLGMRLFYRRVVN